jgi:hypothetical protein
MTLEALQLIEQRSYHGSDAERVDKEHRLNWRAAWNLFNATRHGHIISLKHANSIMKKVRKMFAEVSKDSTNIERFSSNTILKKLSAIQLTDSAAYNKQLSELQRWVFPEKLFSQDQAASQTIQRKKFMLTNEEIYTEFNNLMRILNSIPPANQEFLNFIFTMLGTISHDKDKAWWKDVFEEWKTTEDWNDAVRSYNSSTHSRGRCLDAVWESLSKRGLENCWRGQTSAFDSEVLSSELDTIDESVEAGGAPQAPNKTLNEFKAKFSSFQHEIRFLTENYVSQKNLLELLMAKLQLARVLAAAESSEGSSVQGDANIDTLKHSISKLIQESEMCKTILKARIQQNEELSSTMIDTLNVTVADSKREFEDPQSLGVVQGASKKPSNDSTKPDLEIFKETDKAIQSLYREFEKTKMKMLQESVTTYKLLIDAQFKLSLIDAVLEKQNALHKEASSEKHTLQADEVRVAQSTTFEQFYRPYFLPALLQHVKTICSRELTIHTKKGSLTIDELIIGGYNTLKFQTYAKAFCVNIPKLKQGENDYALLHRVYKCMGAEAALTNYYLQKNVIDRMWDNVSAAHSVLLKESKKASTDESGAEKLSIGTKQWIHNFFDTTNIHSGVFTEASVSWENSSANSSNAYKSWLALQNKNQLATFLQLFTEQQFQKSMLTPQQCFWPRDFFLMLPTGERLDSSICVHRNKDVSSHTGFVGDMVLMLFQVVAQLQLWFSSFSVRQFRYQSDAGASLQALTKVRLEFESTTEYCNTLRTSLFDAFNDFGGYFGVINNGFSELYNHFFTVQNLLGCEIDHTFIERTSAGSNDKEQHLVRKKVFQLIDVITVETLQEHKIEQDSFAMHSDNLFAGEFCALFEETTKMQKSGTKMQNDQNPVNTKVRVAFTSKDSSDTQTIEETGFNVFVQETTLSCPSNYEQDSAIAKAVRRYDEFPYTFQLPRISSLRIGMQNVMGGSSTVFRNELTLLILRYHYAYRLYLGMVSDYHGVVLSQTSLEQTWGKKKKPPALQKQSQIVAEQVALMRKFLENQYTFLLSLKEQINVAVKAKNREIRLFLDARAKTDPYRQATLEIGVEFKRPDPNWGPADSGKVILVTENSTDTSLRSSK